MCVWFIAPANWRGLLFYTWFTQMATDKMDKHRFKINL